MKVISTYFIQYNGSWESLCSFYVRRGPEYAEFPLNPQPQPPTPPHMVLISRSTYSTHLFIHRIHILHQRYYFCHHCRPVSCAYRILHGNHWYVTGHAHLLEHVVVAERFQRKALTGQCLNLQISKDFYNFVKQETFNNGQNK